MCFSVPVTMQGQVIWQEILHMEDLHFRPIAKASFHTALSSKAPSTTKKYLYAFNRWKKWSDDFASIPCSVVSPYLIFAVVRGRNIVLDDFVDKPPSFMYSSSIETGHVTLSEP